MTAPFQNMSDVLTSEQSMSCMDKIPCAFSQAAMSAFCARFTSKVVGVAVATSILFSVGFRVLTPLAGVLLILAAIVGLVRLVHCKTDTPWCYELTV